MFRNFFIIFEFFFLINDKSFLIFLLLLVILLINFKVSLLKVLEFFKIEIKVVDFNL